MVPTWTETCRSRFCNFNVFLTSICFTYWVISWTIKYLWLLMHGVTWKLLSSGLSRCRILWNTGDNLSNYTTSPSYILLLSRKPFYFELGFKFSFIRFSSVFTRWSNHRRGGMHPRVQYLFTVWDLDAGTIVWRKAAKGYCFTCGPGAGEPMMAVEHHGKSHRWERLTGL
jgi:hypothetical protein